MVLAVGDGQLETSDAQATNAKDATHHRVEVVIQPAPANEAKPTYRSFFKQLTGTLPAFAEFLKALAVVAVVLFVILKWPFFARWLDTVTHAEFWGLKFDRAAATQKINELSQDKTRPFNEQFAQAALTRAQAVLPAISGARLLWVDQHPSNNTLLAGILRDIGVTVQLALSTEDAVAFQKAEPFDLVISNQSRKEKYIPLNKCAAAYFAFPDDHIRDEYQGDLNRFNADIQQKPPGGFAMAEQFAGDFPEQFGDTQAPRIILFTAASGGIAASACVRIVTNRNDILLQSVISALEELRWKQLLKPPNLQFAGDGR